MAKAATKAKTGMKAATKASKPAAPKRNGPAPAGDNSLKAMTEDERSGMLFYHVRKNLAARAEKKAAAESAKTASRNAQADGFSADLVNFLADTMSAEDKQAVVGTFFAHAKGLEALKLINPINEKVLRDRSTRGELAAGAGWRAGLEAAERVSGYAPGSSDDEQWLGAYDKAQAHVADNLATAMAKRNAERKASAEELVKSKPDLGKTNAETEGDRQDSKMFN